MLRFSSSFQYRVTKTNLQSVNRFHDSCSEQGTSIRRTDVIYLLRQMQIDIDIPDKLGTARFRCNATQGVFSVCALPIGNICFQTPCLTVAAGGRTRPAKPTIKGLKPCFKLWPASNTLSQTGARAPVLPERACFVFPLHRITLHSRISGAEHATIKLW